MSSKEGNILASLPTEPKQMSSMRQERAERAAMLSSVKSIAQDDHQAGIIIYEMLHLKTKRQEDFLKGRDYLIKNVEKAAVWPDVMIQNLQYRQATKEIETQMVQQRKQETEEDYVRKRQEYQKRWDIYRVQQAELAQKKKQIIEHFSKGIAFHTLIQVKEVIKCAAEELKVRRNIMVAQILRHFAQKRVKRRFDKTLQR